MGAVGNVGGTSGVVGNATQAASNILGKPVTLGQTMQGAGGTMTPALSIASPGQNIPQAQFQPPSVQASGINNGINAAKAEPFKITPATALGATSLISSMGLKQPEFKMPSSIDEIRGKLLSGGQLTDLGLQAKGELSNILKSQPQELFPAANDAYMQSTIKKIDDYYDQAEQQFNAVYNQAGMIGSGEYREGLAKLQKQRADAKGAYAEQENQRRFELARSQKYSAIQTALGVDKNTMDDLVGLTGLDVQVAAMMYGAQVQDVQEIRNALGTLGVEMIMRGQGGYQPQGLGNMNINLGR